MKIYLETQLATMPMWGDPKENEKTLAIIVCVAIVFLPITIIVAPILACMFCRCRCEPR